VEQQPITRVTLDTYQVSDPFPIGSVEARRITIPPNVALGAHWHNGPVFGVIEAGSVHFQVGAEDERILARGDVFSEPAEVTITRFDATADGVTFLAWFPLPGGRSPELTMGDAPG
jgi:quercetin dioxygenase-like cupin family protein